VADQRRFESCGDLDRVNTFDGGTAFAFPRTAPTLSSLVGSTPAAVRSTAAGILCLPIGDLSRRGRRSGFASHLMPAMRNLYVRTQNDCPDGSCLICGTTGHTHASLFQGHDPLGLLCHCCLEQPPSAAAEQLRRRAGESLVLAESVPHHVPAAMHLEAVQLFHEHARCLRALANQVECLAAWPVRAGRGADFRAKQAKKLRVRGFDM